MTQFTPRRSSPRLRTLDYRGAYAYFVTANTYNRQRVFQGPVVEIAVEALYEAAVKRSFRIVAYTFMPDHVHLLVQGMSAESNLHRFMQLFKQLTGFRFKKEIGRNLWHRSYYDHVLRDEEDTGDVAAYIWHNPVRAGLVKDAASYRWSGPSDRLGVSAFDRAEALSLRLQPLFEESAV
jgi:putative transposase